MQSTDSFFLPAQIKALARTVALISIYLEAMSTNSMADFPLAASASSVTPIYEYWASVLSAAEAAAATRAQATAYFISIFFIDYSLID